MGLITFLMITFGQAIGLLLEVLALLIVIRAICGRRSIPVLAEFNDAGRPLVDRALGHVGRFWQRIVPSRPLSPNRLLLVAWLSVTAFRWLAAVLIRVAAQGA